MNDASRREMLTRTALAGGAVAAVMASAACTTDDKPAATGGEVTQDAATVNDLQDQEQKLTIQPFNAVKKLPDQSYPAPLIQQSLEMQNQREKVLRFNDANKLGWAYLFSPNGGLVLTLPVKGKVSSIMSAMTTNVGIYKRDDGDRWGTTTTVPLPGDDLSFGPNEGGDAGKFFFTPDDVYVFWDGPLLYLDAPLDVLSQGTPLKYKDGSTPSSKAPQK